MRQLRIRQNGLTLVELMLSIGLSLFLVLIVAQFFDSNRNSYRTQRSLADIQDRGQFALYVLKQQLRQAGYVDTTNLPNANATNFPVSNPTWATAGHIITGNANSVSVRFRGADDGNVVNCEGGTVPTGTPRSHTFDRDANDKLRCDGNELVPGVLQFVLSYGEDTDGDGIPNRFTATPGNWNNVRAANVCLLLVSLESNVSPSAMTVADCNNGNTAISNNRIARRYQTTIYLRNSGRT